MEPYVYIEFPKCLYNQTGATLTVENQEEEDSAKETGWKTAEEHYAIPLIIAPNASQPLSQPLIVPPTMPDFPWRKKPEPLLGEDVAPPIVAAPIPVAVATVPEPVIASGGVAHDRAGSDHKVL